MGLATVFLLALSSAAAAAATRFAVTTSCRFAVTTSSAGHVSFLKKTGHRGSSRCGGWRCLVAKETSAVIHVTDGLFITVIYGTSIKIRARG
jgi:hypothetical protein